LTRSAGAATTGAAVLVTILATLVFSTCLGSALAVTHVATSIALLAILVALVATTALISFVTVLVSVVVCHNDKILESDSRKLYASSTEFFKTE
jgi:ABC-type antimicrobial peptide transport system permease subunit